MITKIFKSIHLRSSSLIAGVTGSLFFLTCILIMRNGHLHEDAYILFQYSRNLSQGLGISFDIANGPTEGATDFLWMCFLGIFYRIFMGNIPIGIIAALLNSIGLAYIAKEILNFRKPVDVIAIALCILLMVSGGAAASVGGFATVAYGAVYVATFLAFFRKKLTQGLIFSTLLALFRPDGFFLGSTTIIAFLSFEWREINIKQTLGKIISFYLIPLLIYFAWRYSYFGLPLPLPLIVKQKTDSILAGLAPNIESVQWYIPIITVILLYSKSYIRDVLNRRLLIIAASGSLILFALLLFAFQSQNVGYRFNFPLHLSIILIASSAFPRRGKAGLISSILIFTSIVGLSRGFYGNAKYLTNNDYINSFPQILQQRLDLKSIAVTEAGRFPYWFNSNSMIDLIGLNSKDVVLNGPSKVLKQKSPDLIFIHHSNRFIYPDEFKKSNNDFIIFDPTSIQLSEYKGSNPIKLAPVAALNHAIDRSLTGIAVKYGPGDKNYSHIYFVSDSVDIEKFINAIDDSISSKTNYLSSEQLKLSNKIF